ncbi:hypothetical protein CU102_28085 [Phyllobacterium brassicacearum]|uniref:LysR substrate-binding domain-containing protein n=1 Tax=Phyllobacterium brassicacearum TaxID=314235 RepID=A0A2P7AT65_9HYPH|nr:hypothetical protein CU102_28085 [Phyllobacterium brassicacearum]
MITHCADSIVLLLDEHSQVRFVKAPLALPSMPISLIIHKQMASDPATAWLKRLMEKIYADREVRKGTPRAGSSSQN